MSLIHNKKDKIIKQLGYLACFSVLILEYKNILEGKTINISTRNGMQPFRDMEQIPIFSWDRACIALHRTKKTKSEIIVA